MITKNNTSEEVGMTEKRADDLRIDEILKVVKNLDICIRGRADDFNDGGLIGQVSQNTTSIKWLRGLFFSIILVMLGLIIQGILL